MKSTVDEHTYTKLNSGYYGTACKTPQNKAVGSHIHIYNINQQKCHTARYSHCPVGKAASEHLNKAVNYGTEAENCQIFAKNTFCQINHR